MKRLLLVFLLSAVPLYADNRFLDWKNIAASGINTLAQGADLSSTNRDLRMPNVREANPLMRSGSARLGIKFGTVTITCYAVRRFHSAHHHRIERIFPLAVATPAALAVIHNERLHPTTR